MTVEELANRCGEIESCDDCTYRKECKFFEKIMMEFGADPDVISPYSILDILKRDLY